MGFATSINLVASAGSRVPGTGSELVETRGGRETISDPFCRLGSNSDAKGRNWSLVEGEGDSASSLTVIREDVEYREDMEGLVPSKESLGSVEVIASGSSLFVRLNILPIRLAADLAVGLRLIDLIEPGMMGNKEEVVGTLRIIYPCYFDNS